MCTRANARIPNRQPLTAYSLLVVAMALSRLIFGILTTHFRHPRTFRHFWWWYGQASRYVGLPAWGFDQR